MIPRVFRPEHLLTLHQLNLHYRREGIHYEQHEVLFPSMITSRVAHSSSNLVPVNDEILFGLFANLWKAYIEILSNFIPDHLLLNHAR